jgi:hypothetical protein
MLGHQSAAMTLDVYTSLFEDDLDALTERQDEAIAAAPPAVPSAEVRALR